MQAGGFRTHGTGKRWRGLWVFRWTSQRNQGASFDTVARKHPRFRRTARVRGKPFLIWGRAKVGTQVSKFPGTGQRVLEFADGALEIGVNAFESLLRRRS